MLWCWLLLFKVIRWVCRDVRITVVCVLFGCLCFLLFVLGLVLVFSLVD